MPLIIDEKPLGLVVMYFLIIVISTAVLTILPTEIFGLNGFGLSGWLVAMIALEVIIRRLIRNYKVESGLEELVWFAFAGGVILGYDYITVRHFPPYVPWFKQLFVGLIIVVSHAYYFWRLRKHIIKEPDIYKKSLWLVTRFEEINDRAGELLIK